MNQEIIKNIRNTNIKGFILFLLFALFPNIFVIMSFVSNDTDWFMVIIMGVLAIPIDWLCIKCLIVAINPLKSNVFQKYGSYRNLEKIIEEINNTIEYNDGEVIIAKNYIADPNDYERIVACNDVLRVHKLVKKKNFAIVSYSVVLTDKYNFEFPFTYSKDEEEKVDKLLLAIGSKCPNAQLGYTKGTAQYVKENKENLPNISIEEIKED
ncbi:MAG: hypothetical protein ACI4UU_02965 [Clostridia bacterium]